MVGRLRQLNLKLDSVVDVGANIGQFTSAVLAHYPEARITSVEAIPAVYSKLAELLVGYPNVAVFQAALGEIRKRGTFFVNEYTHSSSFLPLASGHTKAFPEAQRTQPVELEIIPLDELLNENGIDSPDLLKLDVQGFEMEVLLGARRTLPTVRWVLLETAFTKLYEGEMLFSEYHSYLSGLGFRFVGPVGFLADPATSVILQMDALYERPHS
jgi:FkbM family methyltransferase